MTNRSHHRIVVIGGGTAGITVAARLRRAGELDIAIVEPSRDHYYQPLWTLVGGGCATVEQTRRPEATLIPDDARWIQDTAVAIDPEEQVVTLGSGSTVVYDHLVVCPGIQLDWDQIPGLPETLGANGVSSNYRPDLAPRTWDFIRNLRSGTAVFGMPSGPIKCAGAPQKIAYLAADYWREEGVLDDIEVVLVLPTPKLFGVPEFNAELEKVVDRYGIDVRLESEVTEVDPHTKEVSIRRADGGEDRLGFDMAHLVPPQSAPDWLKSTPLAVDGPKGWVDVDKHTMQHTRWPNVFALGDAGSTPNAKTGAAIRKQAPVVVSNLLDHMAGRPLGASYGGYGSCPLVTSRHTMLLAEFDYTGRPAPSFPLIDTTKERRDMWYLKKYGLPFLYWNLMLKGRA